MQFISVEAINIYSAVYDTEQLSVIRGSSFLLKSAILDVEKKFKSNIKAVSTGASSGLFSFESCGDADRMTVRDVVAEITQYLNESESYRHFTFVVNYADNSVFQLAKEILVAKQRFKQLQSIAVAPDPEPESAPAPDRAMDAVLEYKEAENNLLIESNIKDRGLTSMRTFSIGD